MDLATILGIISGLGLVFFSIMSKGNIGIFIDIPSFMIVAGGTGAAIFVNFNMEEVFGVFSVLRKVFTTEEDSGLETVNIFQDLAKKARREGILAVDKSLSKVEDDFMRKGLEMAIDGTEPETIREVMQSELEYTMERHKKGQKIFMSLGEYSPAFGMIGTLIGLIIMLRNLDDPSSIGGGMATALITTFYGALMGNLIFLPIAGKLQIRSNEEIIQKEMIIEGVLAIQNGEHPRNITKKLLNFLPPERREEYYEIYGDNRRRG